MSDMTFLAVLFFAAALVFLASSLIFHAEVDRLREDVAVLSDECDLLSRENDDLHWATIPRETPAEVPPVTPTETPIADLLASQRLLRNLNAYAANPVDTHLGEQP